jgi:hypothetical protein
MVVSGFMYASAMWPAFTYPPRSAQLAYIVYGQVDA